MAKTLDLTFLGQLFYLKKPYKPLFGLETHLDSCFYLKYLFNKAKNPGIFPNWVKINTYLRKIYNIYCPKKVGNLRKKAISLIKVF